jgi:hypothetical protein
MAIEDIDGATSVRDETHFAYLFEAKGIQRYIFDSGPLRDLVGASDLVAELARSSGSDARERDRVQAASELVRETKDLIGKVLEVLGIGDEDRFSRRAGGAFCAHATDRQTLDRTRALWRLAVGVRCPGLEFSDVDPVAASDDLEAINRAYEAGTTVRHNSAEELPPTGHPFAAFNPRTGRLTTRLYSYRNDQDVDDVDVVTEAQRRRAEALQGKIDGVARRFLTSETHADGKRYVFPRNLQTADDDEDDNKDNPLFPFNGEDQRVAVIYADLSGLGEIFQSVTKPGAAKDRAAVLAVATMIEDIIEGAARAATNAVLLRDDVLRRWPESKSKEIVQHIVPARPVVLGGDDITILVRADLALPFARRLLEAIEMKSSAAFETSPVQLSTSGLSACAGVAIVKAGQPFLMANALAESLCKFAKTRVKFEVADGSRRARTAPYPSALAFHIGQSTLQEQYEDEILPREMKPTVDGSEILLTANPYGVGILDESVGGPTIDALFALARALDAAPSGRGKLIEAISHLFDDPPAARDAWTRWQAVLGTADPKGLAAVQSALERCRVGEVRSLFAAAGAISDALELVDLGALPHLPPVSGEAKDSAERREGTS